MKRVVALGLRARVAVAALVVGFIAIIALDAVLSRWMRADLRDDSAEDLVRAARLVADSVAALPVTAAPGPASAALLATAARRAQAAGRARVTLLAASGEVLADSRVDDHSLAGLDNHATRPEVLAAMTGRVGRSDRHSKTLGRELLYVAIPMPPQLDGPVRVVRLALSLERVDRLVTRARWWIFGGSTLALVVALVASFITARLTTRSLIEIADVARTMAAGDYRRRATVPGAGELGALAGAMNRLAEELGQSIGRLEEERDLLTAILDGLEEGVLVVGPDGRILRVNPAFQRTLGVGPEAQGRPVAEATRLPELADSVAQCLGSAKVVSRELALRQPPRRLLVLLAPLPTGRGAVALFHDMTAIRRLEAVRRDFVSNVSHELRTPVTALRAAAETLLAGAMNDPEKAASFLGVIHRHAERLSNLISDLLDLSRIESGEMKLRRDLVVLGRAAEKAIEVVDEEARRKRLAIDADLGDLAGWGDTRAVEQVLVNLLDNAVKYTPEGGRIEVRARREGDRVCVSVADTGAGIAAEHLPRIFERFYRVDPGRSREVGGTGLGLAIVKHLVEAMGGDARAESDVGRGSKLLFTLPAA